MARWEIRPCSAAIIQNGDGSTSCLADQLVEFILVSVVYRAAAFADETEALYGDARQINWLHLDG